MIISLKRLNLKQTGDTMVEVLIAITLLSFIMGGAFVITRRSSQDVQAAHERSEALTIAQGQIEQLRIIGAGVHSDPRVNSHTFCLTSDTGSVEPHDNAASQGGGPGGLPALGSPTDILDTTTNYKPECAVTIGSVQYFVAIDYINAKKDYTVHVRWDRAGQGRSEVALTYRNH